MNQPHKFINEKNDAVKNIEKLITSAEYVKSDKDSKGREISYHYLKTKINNENSFIIIKEQENRCSFYSIVDKIK